MQPRAIKWYGWRKQAIDRRDHVFRPRVVHLPPVVDLRPLCPPVMDQGELGACTAHGITLALRYAMMKEGFADRPLARLQLYYDERVIEGTVASDAGAEIRDGIKSAGDTGVAPEPLWPYTIDRFRQNPSANVYAGALKFRALHYQAVGAGDGTAHASDMKAAIASGYPCVFGFNVFAQFESDQCAKDGLIAMPAASEQSIGGHCVAAVGYGQRPGCFTIQNSWAADWGDAGFCYMPEAFLEQQGSDFWIITKAGLAA